jgi:salicylate hydroxylase
MSIERKTTAEDGIRVVVIGAGLAGLGTAIATKLANPAHHVTICESVKELQEVGVRSSTQRVMRFFSGCNLFAD